MTTIFDRDTDRYLDQVGESDSACNWADVVRRTRQMERRRRLARVAVVSGTVAAATTGALAGVGTIGGLDGPTIVEKAEAAVLEPVEAASGTIEHILVEYRDESGTPFIEYETWIAADGAWCRQTVEGMPAQATDDAALVVATTRLTECRSEDGLIEVYLPATNEILQTREAGQPPGSAESEPVSVPVEPGASAIVVRLKADGTLVVERDGKVMTTEEIDALPEKTLIAIKRAASQAGATRIPHVDPGPAPDWLTEDVIEAFRRDAVHEAGTMVFEGREYTKLVTEGGLDAVLVDPETGESVAWIPSPEAFGAPTIVVRTREALPDDARTRRSLTLTELHPDATVRAVTPLELNDAMAAQYPRG
jgi:hypothetical protein